MDFYAPRESRGAFFRSVLLEKRHDLCYTRLTYYARRVCLKKGGGSMSVLLAILLGLVQGVTEFLPVSSSGHLSLLQTLFHVEYSEEQHLLFNVLLHLGTLVAICFAYREDLKKMSKGGVRLLQGQMDFSIFGDPLIPATRQLLCLLVGLLPLIPVLLLNRYISALFSMPGFIGFAFIANGFLLFVCDRLIRAGNKTARTISPADGFWIGLAQACAVLPGLSLMGATLTASLSRGCSRSYSMRFSLLLSIPAVASGLIVSLVRCFSTGVQWSLLPAYLIGFAVSALVGFAAIRLLRAVMRRGRFGHLSTYCWAVGALTIVLSVLL